MSAARVLIVEDEAGIRLALSGLLRARGLRGRAGERRRARRSRMLRAGAFDLVLTDLALGSGPSGLDVLRCAKRARSPRPRS